MTTEREAPGPGAWRKSSFCANGTCVEVQLLSDTGIVRIRDSKNPEGPVLAFDAEEWKSFLSGARAAEFDI